VSKIANRNGSSFAANKKRKLLWVGVGKISLPTDFNFTQRTSLLYRIIQPLVLVLRRGRSYPIPPITGFLSGYRRMRWVSMIYGRMRGGVFRPRLTLNLVWCGSYFGTGPTTLPNQPRSNFYFGESGHSIPGNSCNPFFPTNIPCYGRELREAFQVRNTSSWNKDLNNFGPRIGFAWNTFWKLNTVFERLTERFLQSHLQQRLREQSVSIRRSTVACSFVVLQTVVRADQLRRREYFLCPSRTQRTDRSDDVPRPFRKHSNSRHMAHNLVAP